MVETGNVDVEKPDNLRDAEKKTLGVFVSQLSAILKREGRQFPWKKALPIILIALVVIAGIYAAIVYFHLHFIRHWPFLTK